MRIALAQMAMRDDADYNHQVSLEWIARAAKEKADIICFPELQFCRFFPQHPNLSVTHLAQSIDDPKLIALRDQCRRLGIAAVPNIYLLEHDKYFDASLMIDKNGEILGASKMVHIARVPQFYEQDYYTPSDSGFKVYDTSVGKIGIVVCFDRHYPESIRRCALDGADLIIVPTANTTAEPMELFEWEMRVAAYQNNVFIAMCNRVGTEDDMQFSGESLICGPDGGLVKKTGHTETLLHADISLGDLEKYRKSKPYLLLRHPEHY